MKKSFFAFLVVTLSALVAFPAFAEEGAKAAPEMRLYRLACGEVGVSDINMFSDTDAYLGQSKDLVVSCYLIKHGDDLILWDTGLPSIVATDPESMKTPFKLALKEPITQQLEKLAIKPEDIDYVALSHGHFDHTGDANSFPNAKLIMQKTEYDFMTSDPEKAKASFLDPAYISRYIGEGSASKVMLLSGDADIFGDGTMKAISLPGHTPGHMALLINLPQSGAVVLSGDQWHFRENHETNGVPSFNYNRADTLGSSDKLNNLIKNRKARLIIQHEAKDNQELPVLPEFLQ